MNEILLWIAGAWVLAMGLVFALLGMSSKQASAARDEETVFAVRFLGSANDDSAESFASWERRLLSPAPLEGEEDIARQWNRPHLSLRS